MNVQLSSGTRGLMFDLILPLPPYCCIGVVKALVILHRCVGMPEPSLLAYAICTVKYFYLALLAVKTKIAKI